MRLSLFNYLALIYIIEALEWFAFIFLGNTHITGLELGLFITEGLVFTPGLFVTAAFLPLILAELPIITGFSIRIGFTLSDLIKQDDCVSNH